MKTFLTFSVFLSLVAIGGCGDPAPTDFIPQTILEGFLIVGEPIHNIKIMRSQSILDTFRYANGAITDADVQITVDGRTLQLQYRANEGVGEYYYQDTTELIQPTTPYRISATLRDGSVLTGETTTPARIEWVQAPKDTLQYPNKDSLNVKLPDSLRLIWSAAPGMNEYPISVRCLDTTEYGKYLAVATNEQNMRIERDFDRNDPRYADVSRWGFLQGTSTPVSWAAFKWYGLHEVNAWAGDRNFLNWLKLTQFSGNPSYDWRLGSVKGGIGVFASASVARKLMVLLKGKDE